MAGLTPQGFVRLSQAELEILLEGELLQAFPTLNTRAGPIHQLIGIIAEQQALLWEAAEASHAAIDPNRAFAEALDAVAALTGTLRRAPTRSVVLGTVNLEPGATLPAGSTAEVVDNPEARFLTVETVTNPADAAADVTVRMAAENTGPIAAPAGTLTVIATPVAGWNSITNAEDATLGRNVETDPELRLRREAEVAGTGSANLDAIIAAVREVAGVVEATGLENVTSAPDANGVEAHSFEIIFFDRQPPQADDVAIAQAIWETKPAGIRAQGTASAFATDAAGDPQPAGFTRAAERAVFVNITVTTDETYPSDGDAQLAQALAAFGDANLGIGDDVVLQRLCAVAFTVTGVIDVTDLRISFSAADPGIANLPVGIREIADLDTSRITVSSS